MWQRAGSLESKNRETLEKPVGIVSNMTYNRRTHAFLISPAVFIIISLFLALSPSLPALRCAHALDVPPLKGYVNDYANMISPSAKAKIEAELKSFEQSDSTQVVILTIPSLKGEVLEDFSIKVAETWKIGQKGKDNGIVLLVANQERKIRIEVGRGLEGRLTDLTAGRIIDLVIKPRFKRGDFDGGFVAGISSLIDATRGEFKVEDKPRPARVRRHVPIPTLLIFGGIALFMLGSFSRVLGGMAGAVGLPLIAYLAIAPFGLITLIFLAVLGLIMGILLPLFGGHGGGPFLGGGSWGGGGDGGDSGGFGGGGGDFGGGGASGDW
jgi:uncharacterized protein